MAAWIETPILYISHSNLTRVAFCVYACEGTLCAVRERIRRVFVIFPCFSDLQAVFTDFRTRYETLF